MGTNLDMENSIEPKAYPPIGRYGLLSDCHSAALVSTEGSVDWCCFHRFDARPVFARLLDWKKGGYFQISLSERLSTTRRYIPGTHVLETTMEGPSGTIRITDCLPVAKTDTEGEHPHPYHQLLRLVECIEGEPEVDVVFAPRFEYGKTTPRMELVGEHTAVVVGGPDALVLQSEPTLAAELDDGYARFRLVRGELTRFALTHYEAHRFATEEVPAQVIDARLEDTIEYWKEWSGRSSYDGPHEQYVLRSALVLKGLTNSPTGAIAAAVTTSLPEEIGGVRNWDYRFNWLRDAALNLYALFHLGYRAEAEAFMHWLQTTTAGHSEDLQIMYGLGGERLLPEVELDWLEGYRGSRPVRIGNHAAEQFQLDVYGYLLDAAWQYHRHKGQIDNRFWSFLCGVVDVVCANWGRPDQGIWEIRAEPRHFVSSKVLAWVAMDRGLKLASELGMDAPVDRWTQTSRDIRQDIEINGVHPTTGSFVQSYGSTALDASNLLIPLVGFLPPDDERVRATVDRTLEELAPNGYCYRYLTEDGLPGGEGVFVICTFWLASNLALVGRVDEAQQIFERMLSHANDLGLLAEEIDPHSGELLGNFPQAFSHVGLIGSAVNIERARKRFSE